MEMQDRLLGGLLGAVVGDAVGVPVEFLSRDELRRDPVQDMRGWGTHRQPAGTWSDDTSMALCLAESITNVGWDLKDQAHRFSRWAFEQHWTPHGETFDIGGTTLASLKRYIAGTPARNCGGRDEKDNGNGALMRILPAAVWFSGTCEEIIVNALSGASAVTHAHGRTRLACVYFGFLVRALIDGATPKQALQRAAADIRRLSRDEILDAQMREEVFSLQRILDTSVMQLPEEEIRSSGYVIDTLEASIWSLTQTSSYQECLLTAVNLGGDTDTIGTVAGGLSGILYGSTSIPPEWIEGLARREEISELLSSLVEMTVRPVPFSTSYWVLPGKLLAGEYPRNRDQESSKRKLDALLDAQVSFCVDLTEEGEYGLLPYEELLNSRIKTRTIPSRPGPQRCAAERISIPDGEVPTVADLRRIHQRIREELHAGEIVYTHCWGGHGRTGTVIGTWLVDSGLSVATRAQEALTRLRRGIDTPETPSPETRRQIELLRHWEPVQCDARFD